MKDKIAGSTIQSFDSQGNLDRTLSASLDISSHEMCHEIDEDVAAELDHRVLDFSKELPA
jgi:hypothetical protein